jgi:acetylornithine deacetylase/succinyl-diaminopimelate desuccinylase-like protein
MITSFANGQSFSELIDRLGSKWKRGTTQTLPPLRLDGLERQAKVEAIMGHLIAIPTISDNHQANDDALALIKDYLDKRGMHTQSYSWNNTGSLVATTHPTKKPKVLFSAHLDVVPGTPDLFELRSREGKYFGRGVFDMKFAIALYMQLVDELQDHLHEYDFGIMITCDEEVGGFDGVKRLVEEEGYRPQVVVLPDGGDNWQMETFAKGLWHVTLAATGKNAHGSRPWEGKNAIDKLMDALQEIRQLFPEQGPDTSTLTIGMIRGGKVTNQVADKASASLDFRFNSLEDQQHLIDQVETIAEKYDIPLDTFAVATVMINDPENTHIHSFMESVRAVTGAMPGTVKSFGLTDARYFADLGIPCAIVRPPGGELHGPGEWIDQQGLMDLLDVFKHYADKEARKSSE